MAFASEVAIEIPISIRYCSLPHAVMMGTPADLEDFAVGFSLSEGIIETPADIRHLEVSMDATEATIDIGLIPDVLRRKLARKRSLSGRSSCGVCGIEDSKHLEIARPSVAEPGRPIEPRAIAAGLADLRRFQPLHGRTRCVHGAAWCDISGAIQIAREDVGRHNALDKLIGATLHAGLDISRGFILVTSRASFEMVEKAAVLGAHTLAAVSAPTSLAISRAEKLGLTLVTTARAESCVVHAGRLAQ
ncbi:hypothetical protein ASE63_00615 [Bosea sp. Root381]|uniref:formate dehydrogenase accessory sulfurtransferase FdhD n=1 Tax=Bosea sp. Root381 TaxID=1736524 RepID=UPI0006F8055B|nr:formate dehydrogenase accessory sulfurtransferase FdhD [Bosea sp. Root381]KRE17742.1 hypothetical protein ASE63_00615 [Bosea sp. Root381]